VRLYTELFQALSVSRADLVAEREARLMIVQCGAKIWANVCMYVCMYVCMFVKYLVIGPCA